MSILQVLSVFLLSGTLVKTSRILGVFPSPGYSQFILAEKLMTELVKKGHEVTVISPFEPKLPPKNYTTISTNGLIETAFDCECIRLLFYYVIVHNLIFKLYEYVGTIR